MHKKNFIFGNIGEAEKSARIKIDDSIKKEKPLSLNRDEVKSRSFQEKIASSEDGPRILDRITPDTLRLIREEGAVPKVKDDESGSDRAFRDAGVRSRREQIRILHAVYDFLNAIGRKASEFKDGKIKIDPAQAAKNAVWMTASTAIPGLRIAKSIAERVIKATFRSLMLWYNNNCGGRAGETIGDFSDVGSAERQEGRCQAAKDEPKWVDTGFRPYVWETAVSTSRWSYSPLGLSKSKSEIKDLLEDRKKRKDKKPNSFQKGGKNILRPLPAVIR